MIPLEHQQEQSVGTEVTNTSVSAGAEANVEAHASIENENQIGDVTISQEAHANVEAHAEAQASAGWDGRNATALMYMQRLEHR
jgi:hypothetical protein